MPNLPFSSQFTKASGSQQVAATGLTVTCTVRQVALSNNAITSVVTNGAAFEIGEGLYGYTYTGTPDFTAYWYNAVFTTADATVQQTKIASAWFDYPASISKTSAGKISEVVLLTGNTPQSGDNYPRLGAPVGASVSADLAAVKAETDTILSDVNTGAGAIWSRIGAPANGSIAADIATRMAASAYTAPPSASANATALLDAADAIETGVTPRLLLRYVGSVLLGLIADSETNTEIYAGVGVGTARVTATVDSQGNRTSIVLS